MKRLTLSFCLLLAFSASGSATELLTNPDFDSAGTGWGKFGNADFNNFFGNEHASLFMDNPGNSGGFFQLGISATPGLEYTFELPNVRIEENAAANLRFGLEFYEADDTTKLGETIVPIPLTTTGDGLAFSMAATAVAGTAIVRPIVLFDNVTSTANGQENAFFFSASLTVPEPGSLLLVGAGGLALLRRRIQFIA